jgi:hypothetical protein
VLLLLLEQFCYMLAGIFLICFAIRSIQPFPRREFSNSDLQRSLKELGLVPNGSLAVVVHKEPQQQSMIQLSGKLAYTHS